MRLSDRQRDELRLCLHRHWGWLDQRLKDEELSRRKRAQLGERVTITKGLIRLLDDGMVRLRTPEEWKRESYGAR